MSKTRVRVVSLRSFDPVVASLSPRAFRVWAKGIEWSLFHGTEGVLTAKCIKTVGATPSDKKELLETGLWEGHERGGAIICELRYGPFVADTDGDELTHDGESSEERARRMAAERQRRYRRKTAVGPSVYVMRRESDGALKIGYSDNPGDRVRAIQYELGCQVELMGWRPGTLQDERSWHARFAALRIGTTEWFKPSEEIVREIALREYCPDDDPDNGSDNAPENGPTVAQTTPVPHTPSGCSGSGSSPDPEGSSALTSSPKDLKESARVSEERAEIERVFDYWKLERKKRKWVKLDKKREARIRRMLRHGFTPEQLETAIKNAKLDPFLMGENDAKKVYDGLQTLLRDAEQVERLLELKPANGSRVTSQTPAHQPFKDPEPSGPTASPAEALAAISGALAGIGRRIAQ